MSCQMCNQAQDGTYNSPGKVVRVKDGGKAYYRWKNANIEMNGCDEHLREIFEVLNRHQFGN